MQAAKTHNTETNPKAEQTQTTRQTDRRIEQTIKKLRQTKHTFRTTKKQSESRKKTMPLSDTQTHPMYPLDLTLWLRPSL